VSTEMGCSADMGARRARRWAIVRAAWVARERMWDQRRRPERVCGERRAGDSSVVVAWYGRRRRGRVGVAEEKWWREGCIRWVDGWAEESGD
jgi:hypothetical protein